MTGNSEGIFYLTQFSAGSLIAAIFSITFALFFIIGRNRSKATKNMGIAFALLSLFHFALFAAFSLYNPYAAYHRCITVASVMFTQIHIILFVIQYPDNRNLSVSKYIRVSLYIISFIISLFYIIQSFKSPKAFTFDGHFWDIDNKTSNFAAALTIMFLSLLSIFIVIWRLFQLKKRELFSMLLVTIPFIIGMIIPAILNLLNRQGFISREILQVTLNTSHIFGFFIMSMVHLNTTRDRFTFMGKIVGVTFVTFLTIFLVISRLYIDNIDTEFHLEKNNDFVQGISGKVIDPGYSYVLSYSSRDNRIIEIFKNPDIASIPEVNHNELRKIYILELIKAIPESDFNYSINQLIKETNGDTAFSGYNILLDDLTRYPSKNNEVKLDSLIKKISDIRYSIQFHNRNIMKIPVQNFNKLLDNYLEDTPDYFIPFRTAILKLPAHLKNNPAQYKDTVLSIVSPMYDIDSTIFREFENGKRFISFIHFDEKTEYISEAGFSYIEYRKFIHGPTSRLIFLVSGIMLFMLIGYPWLYYGTLYVPLKSLLDGVEEVKSGNLNVHLEIKSEDEIGLLTDRFNLMVDRLISDREAIFQSEKKYRELTDLLPDIIYETDNDLNISYMNNSGFILTEYNENDIKNGLSLNNLLRENDRGIFKNFISADDSKSEKVLNTTHYVLRKSGNKFLGDNSVVKIFRNGNVAGIRGIIRDITEKKMNEEALIQMQKMDSIGSLAGGIAHDFNNILGGIMGPLSLIRFSINKNKFDPEEFEILLATMESSSSRAVNMVRQLLSLSHKSPSIYEPVDISVSVKNVYKICSTTFDKSIELVLNLPDEPVMTEGDATQIEQSILNICINASHAMTIMREENEKPGGKLTISISKIKGDYAFKITHPSCTADFYWHISISDTGVGMDQETVSKIFLPFFTTKDKTKGTGLGLSMVYSIIRNHKGFIDVYSTRGVGSIFNIYLPLLNSCKVSEELNEKGIYHGTGNILVIDDEEIIRKTARLILEKCGYRVITASESKEALSLISDSCDSVDLVLIDLIMPGISGDQLLSDIKKLCSENVQILLASGLTDDSRISKAIEKTGCSFIQKPYTMENLSKTVYEMLNKK